MPDCPQCGAPTDDDARECPECGAVLEGATTPFSPVGSPEGEPCTTSAEGRCLLVRKGPAEGERFYVEGDELTIGRDPDCDVFLNDITVSRTHAVIRVEADVVTVEDAGSLNGTYVNGVRVDSAPLCDGDTLQVGRFVMTFSSGGDA